MKNILTIFVLISLVSCSTTNKVKNISTPKKREIKKAMKYSTSDYAMPDMKIYYQKK